MLIAKNYIVKGNCFMDSITLLAFAANPHWISIIFYIRIMQLQTIFKEFSDNLFLDGYILNFLSLIKSTLNLLLLSHIFAWYLKL